MWNVPTKEQLARIPKLYATEKTKLKDVIIHLHFFIGGSDWYIAEFDGDDTFFGFAVLNNDTECAEWGYSSFSELKAVKAGWLEIDNDLHWKPTPAQQIDKIRSNRLSSMYDSVVSPVSQYLQVCQDDKMPMQVYIYADGACSGNPGPGGAGAVLICGEHRKELSVPIPDTTNNRAELTAVIIGLQALKKPCDVIVYSDSQYVVRTMTAGWKRNANHDLWEQLDSLTKNHRVSFVRVAGHAGIPENERADRLAKQAVGERTRT